jgi:hypothetical protein
MNVPNTQPEAIQSMDSSLLHLDDEAFLRQVYLRLLGRAADAPGLQGYLEQLQQGASRHDIYQELATSEEGQRYEARRRALRRNLTVVPQAAPMAPSPVALAQPQWLPVLVESWDEPTVQVASVQELLDLEGVAFIKAAYIALLGREVDEEGGTNYARKLRSGWSKMSIVKGLASSDEARQFGAQLPGLHSALQRYAKAQRRSWGGWYYRSVLGVESDLPLERSLRATHLALHRQ